MIHKNVVMVNRVILPLTNTERDGLTHAGCGCHLRHDGKGEAILDKSDLSRAAGGEVLPGDEEEGDEDKEASKYDGDRFLVKNVRDAEAAAAPSSGEIDKDERDRNPPIGEAEPRPIDLIPHFIGDERKNK